MASNMDKEHVYEHDDVVPKSAAASLEAGVDSSLAIDPEEERKLVRKIDLYILPSMWIMYLLSYMDRTK
jgi:hypothetical protein